jgi:hypothetical protein
VGEVEDIIIAPDKSLSYPIIGVGGFLGLGRHDVAIPVEQFKNGDGKILALPELPWYSNIAKHAS